MAVNAQEWAPVGTKWYYSNLDQAWINLVPRVIESIGDTFIDGHLSKKIIGRCDCGMTINDTNYLYSDSSKVFIYNDSISRFTLLYDFNLNSGETWTIIPPNPPDSFVVKVDSISNLILNNDTFKVQHVSTTYPAKYEFISTIIENIGSSDCLFPQNSLASPGTGPLRCYENPTTGIYKFPNYHFGTSFPCDTTIFLYSIEDINNSNSISLYPNPTNSKINIQFESKNFSQINIYNLFGIKQKVDISVKTNEIELDVNNLKSGVYILEILIDAKVVKKQFIKVK